MSRIGLVGHHILQFDGFSRCHLLLVIHYHKAQMTQSRKPPFNTGYTFISRSNWYPKHYYKSNIKSILFATTFYSNIAIVYEIKEWYSTSNHSPKTTWSTFLRFIIFFLKFLFHQYCRLSKIIEMITNTHYFSYIFPP